MAGLFQRAQDVAGAAAAGAKDAAGSAASGAKRVAGKGLTHAQEALQQRGDYMQLGTALGSYVTEHVDLRELRDVGFGLVGDQLVERKKRAKGYLFDMTAGTRARTMLAIREMIKSSAVADPDMCECLKQRIETTTDLFWDDLMIYIETNVDDSKQATLGRVATEVEELGQLGVKPAFCSPMNLRAFILYHWLPYDISFFGQLKDPVFWVLTAISLMTFWGIRVLFFAVIVIFIRLGSPADEFQLVQFILMLKGTQFLSSGVCMAIAAAVKYYLCVHPGGTHTCDVDGPGANQDIVSGSVDFFGSCLLVWTAFLWLPWSQRSAGTRELGTAVGDADKEPQDTTDAESGKRSGTGYDKTKGGRLTGVLSWDVFSFILSLILLCGLVFVDAAHMRPGGKASGTPDTGELIADTTKWTFRSSVFWARIFYSFMTLPFLAFWLPGLSGILTHTTPTGYNRNGLCVPYYLHPVPDKEKE